MAFGTVSILGPSQGGTPEHHMMNPQCPVIKKKETKKKIVIQTPLSNILVAHLLRLVRAKLVQNQIRLWNYCVLNLLLGLAHRYQYQERPETIND